MARERQFARGGENTQPRERAIIRGPLDENCLGKIHFARDCLHRRGSNAVAIGDHRQRISGKWFGGEYVECVESPLHVFFFSARSAGRVTSVSSPATVLPWPAHSDIGVGSVSI